MSEPKRFKDPVLLAKEIFDKSKEITSSGKKLDDVYPEWDQDLKECSRNEREYIVAAGYLLHYSSGESFLSSIENKLNIYEDEQSNSSKEITNLAESTIFKRIKEKMENVIEGALSNNGSYKDIEKDILVSIANSPDLNSQSLILRYFDTVSEDIERRNDSSLSY